jgi:hypothetical protein
LALVLGDHALDLQEQVRLGSVTRRVTPEDDLDTAAGEFLEHQNLIGIFAGETIGVENVAAIDGTGRGLVPESFQSRAGQEEAAVALVHEPQFGIAFRAVTGHPLQERLPRAGDGVLLLLLVPGYPGRERHTKMVGGHGWSSSPGLGSETLDRGRLVAVGSRSRPLQGARDDRDQGLICKHDQGMLKPSELETACDERARSGPT